MGNIDQYLSEGALEMHYQPIFSMRECRIVGFEALVRTKGSQANKKGPQPKELFALAQEAGKVLELDRLCRKLAVQGFVPLVEKFPNTLLFVNIESTIVDQGVVGSGHMREVVLAAGLQPTQVCIEINESGVDNKEGLIEFARIHKRFGFLIAIDDMGAGHSNFERITQLQPDIIKLDMSLIQGMQFDIKKAQIVRLLCELSANMGTLVVAEGVEAYQEVVDFYQFGGDLVQGFYLSIPEQLDKFEPMHWKKILSSAVQHAKDAEMVRLERGKAKQKKHRQDLETLCEELNGLTIDELEQALKGYIRRIDDCECLYAINSNGIQVTETITRKEGMTIRNQSLYKVAERGADHSYKDYFYIPFMGEVDVYASEPYVSRASGNRCRTYSAWIALQDAGRSLICMDIIEFE